MSSSDHCPDFSLLNEHGLNLQAVFDLSKLPKELHDSLAATVPAFSCYRRLLLFGHGGRRMWEAMQASGFSGEIDPIDSFSLNIVQRWLSEGYPEATFEMLYPAAERLVPLQQLGALAGWHHASPFRIGINREWGSWFAYRVALLIDVELPVSKPEVWGSPCDDCAAKPCIAACPAGAVIDENNMLSRCVEFRLEQESACLRQCLSRLACPVAKEHRYLQEQIDYHYGQSLQTIRRWKQQER